MTKKKDPKDHGKKGRPTKINPEVVDLICKRIRGGESVHTISLSDDMPCEATVYNWLADHEDFLEKYKRAREAQADKMAEEILDIADDSSRDITTITRENGREEERVDFDNINRSRLRVDTRKWLMSKLAPKKYGDKIQQEISGKDGAPIQAVINFGQPQKK